VNPACERYLNAINELVDGTLGPLRRAELDLHLETCDDCRALVKDLQRIVDAAGSLPALRPPDRVWTQIVDRLQDEGQLSHVGARFRFGSNRTWLALAAALILAVSASLFVVFPRSGQVSTPQAPPVAGTPAPTDSNATVQDPVQRIDSQLASIAQQLDDVIEETKKSGAAMDPQTAAVMQKNMPVINQAIAETRAVLKTDPNNAEARQSLYEMLKRKIQFLQDTIALMNEMRQGDAAGAAQLVEGGKS
jgi:Putative zinc-finger